MKAALQARSGKKKTMTLPKAIAGLEVADGVTTPADGTSALAGLPDSESQNQDVEHYIRELEQGGKQEPDDEEDDSDEESEDGDVSTKGGTSTMFSDGEDVSGDDDDCGDTGDEDDGGGSGDENDEKWSALKPKVKRSVIGNPQLEKKKAQEEMTIREKNGSVVAKIIKCRMKCGGVKGEIRWAKPHGKLCWACWRTYKSLYKHKSASVKAALVELGKNPKAHKTFYDRRRTYEEVAKQKGKRVSLKKMRLVTNSRYEEALALPDDLFVPWRKYQKKWGTTVQRKLGHRRCEFRGMDGVRIPTGEEMRIKRQHVSGMQVEKLLGTEQDVMCEQEMFDKYEDCISSSALEDAPGATVCDILRDYGLAAVADLNIPCVLSAACGSAGGGDGCLPHVFTTPDNNSRKGKGNLQNTGPMFSLRTHEEADSAPKNPRANQGQGQKKTVLAIGGGMFGSVLKKEESTKSANTNTSAKSTKSASQSSGSGTGDHVGGRGRRARTTDEVMGQYDKAIDDFLGADESDDDIYVGPAAINNLHRYGKEANDKITKCGEKMNKEDLDKYVFGRKRIWIMEAILRCYRSFKVEGPRVNLLKTWNEQVAIAATDPKVPLKDSDLPSCIRRALVGLRGAQDFGNEETMQSLTISSLSSLYKDKDQVITIQLNVVRNGFTSLLRTETLDVRMPELQKVSKIITENPTGWGAEVRDEVQDVQGVMSLDEAVLEGLLLMSSENGETLLKQLKHYPVGKEVLARGKNHAAGVNELTKKKNDGAALLNDPMAASIKALTWDTIAKNPPADWPLMQLESFLGALVVYEFPETVTHKRVKEAVVPIAQKVMVLLCDGVKVVVGVCVESLLVAVKTHLQGLAAELDKERTGKVTRAMNFLKKTMCIAGLPESSGSWATSSVKPVLKVPNTDVVNETIDQCCKWISALGEPLGIQNAKKRATLENLVHRSFMPTNKSKIQDLNKLLEKKVHAPSIKFMKETLSPLVRTFTESLKKVLPLEPGLFDEDTAVNPDKYDALAKKELASEKLIETAVAFEDTHLVRQVSVYGKLFTLVTKMAAVVHLGWPTPASPTPWRIGEEDKQAAATRIDEMTQAHKELVLLVSSIKENEKCFDTHPEWKQLHIELKPQYEKMVKTVETFKKKLKSTVEQDISNLLENVADACPVALADLGDGYVRNAEVIKKLLGNRKYVELERFIVSLRSWQVRGFRELKKFGLDDSPNEECRASIVGAVKLGKATMACTIAALFLFSELPNMKDAPEKVAAAAAKALQKIKGIRADEELPTSTKEMLERMSQIPVKGSGGAKRKAEHGVGEEGEEGPGGKKKKTAQANDDSANKGQKDVAM